MKASVTAFPCWEPHTRQGPTLGFPQSDSEPTWVPESHWVEQGLNVLVAGALRSSAVLLHLSITSPDRAQDLLSSIQKDQ